MAKLLISPHPDDECLFASYTILREKPTVIIVTFPTLQGDNGFERLMESYNAMSILGAEVKFLRIKEHEMRLNTLKEAFKKLYTEDTVYLPEYEGGNPHHDLVNIAGKAIFPNIKTYKTYTGFEDRSIGEEVIPTPEELELKKKAMACYKSQIKNPLTAHYFNTYAEYR